jgi:hypothetical protein
VTLFPEIDRGSWAVVTANAVMAEHPAQLAVNAVCDYPLSGRADHSIDARPFLSKIFLQAWRLISATPAKILLAFQ